MKNDFVKRIKVKGYPRTTSQGRVYMVSPHYRVIRKLREDSGQPSKRPKLV